MPTEPIGPPGRDAVLIVKTDTANNVIHIIDKSGNQKATLVSIPGKDGLAGGLFASLDGGFFLRALASRCLRRDRVCLFVAQGYDGIKPRSLACGKQPKADSH